MTYDLLIRNGQLVRETGVAVASIGVIDGRITDIAADLPGTAKEQIDAAGLHIFPGLIDPHVHFNEPGRTDWEGFNTGSAALAAGGGTCFFDMPLNASPPTLDGKSFDLKRRAAEAASRTDFALWGGLTPNNLASLDELAERGVIGFKAFMSNSGIEDFARADDRTLRHGMKIAQQLDLLVAVHAEDDELTTQLAGNAQNAGRFGITDYLNSRPIIAEVNAIRRAIHLAQQTGCRLHIVHISSAAGSREVVAGKKLTDVTGETCPHYLCLCDNDVKQLGAAAKCAPPLRTNQEAEELWTQVVNGGIDFVASDHSPAPQSMKQSDDFFKVWGGIAGVQSTLSLLLTRRPALPLPRIAALTSNNIARRFRIPRKGSLQPGFDADFALVDINAEYKLTRDQLLDRHKFSPYVGRNLRGVVRRTIVRGNTIFNDGKLVGEFRGSLVRPEGVESRVA